MHKRKIINPNMIGLAGVGGLLILGFLTITPEFTMGHAAHATLTTTAGVAITANAEATVAISVDDRVSIDLTPASSSTGVFNSGTSRLKVATNNTSGYAIYLGTVDETGNLAPILQGSQDKAITPVVDNTLGSSFNTNTWGYNLSKVEESGQTTAGANGVVGLAESGGVDTASLSYNAVPTSSQVVHTTGSANLENNDEYDLTFGVNIDNTLPAGTYTNSVLVSVVANPITISELSQLTYMQDMTTSICEHTPMPTTLNGQEVTATKQLVDTRDGKKYWVAKLRDGNCWMVQNLALDLSTERTLTPADTDVSADYTPESSTRVDDTPNTDKTASGAFVVSPEFSGTGGDTQASRQYSWGIWQNTVLATPLYGRTCNGVNSIISSEQLYETCSGEGFIDTTGWKPTFIAQQGTIELKAGNETDVTSSDPKYPYNYTGIIAANPNAQTYDAHYLVGNYYQFNTATAGTGSTATTNTNAPSSICPKGWTLPRSGDQEATLSRNTDNGTFYNLLNAYSVANTARSISNNTEDTTSTRTVNTTLRDYNAEFDTTANINSGTVAQYTNTAGEFHIAASPLYFVANGALYLNVGYIREVNSNGVYWSRSRGGTDAYLLLFSPSSGVYPSRGPYMRYLGYAVRCLAQ